MTVRAEFLFESLLMSLQRVCRVFFSAGTDTRHHTHDDRRNVGKRKRQEEGKSSPHLAWAPAL